MVVVDVVVVVVVALAVADEYHSGHEGEDTYGHGHGHGHVYGHDLMRLLRDYDHDLQRPPPHLACACLRDGDLGPLCQVMFR